MFDVFFVTLREALEVILLLAAIAAYLPAARRPELLRMLGVGAVIGSAIGIVVSAGVSRSFDPLIDAVLTLLFGVFLAWMAAGMLASESRIGRGIRASIDLWAERLGWPVAVALIAAIVTFREAFEVGFFVLRHADANGWQTALTGSAFGLTAALLLPLAGSLLKWHAHLALAFRISALLLSYFALSIVVGSLFEIAALSGWLGSGPIDALVAQAETSRALLIGMLMLIPVFFILRDWWTEIDGAPVPPITHDRAPGGRREPWSETHPE